MNRLKGIVAVMLVFSLRVVDGSQASGFRMQSTFLTPRSCSAVSMQALAAPLASETRAFQPAHQRLCQWITSVLRHAQYALFPMAAFFARAAQFDFTSPKHFFVTPGTYGPIPHGVQAMNFPLLHDPTLLVDGGHNTLTHIVKELLYQQGNSHPTQKVLSHWIGEIVKLTNAQAGHLADVVRIHADTIFAGKHIVLPEGLFPSSRLFYFGGDMVDKFTGQSVLHIPGVTLDTAWMKPFTLLDWTFLHPWIVGGSIVAILAVALLAALAWHWRTRLGSKISTSIGKVLPLAHEPLSFIADGSVTPEEKKRTRLFIDTMPKGQTLRILVGYGEPERMQFGPDEYNTRPQTYRTFNKSELLALAESGQLVIEQIPMEGYDDFSIMEGYLTVSAAKAFYEQLLHEDGRADWAPADPLDRVEVLPRLRAQA